MKITNEIKEILEQGHFEENVYKLPDIQLDRKLYKQVNSILESLGGKWKTRVGHQFNSSQENLENALEIVLEKGETETLDEVKKRFQFYPTPPEVAETLVELADCKDYESILEPSVGKGAIIDQLKGYLDVTMIEFNEELKDGLIAKYLGIEGFELKFMNFLEYSDKTFDKIIMNPPFTKNQDVKHILHAYSLLEKGGRLVTIAPTNLLDKSTKLHQELKESGIEKVMELGEGAFRDAGTMINTAIYIINK